MPKHPVALVKMGPSARVEEALTQAEHAAEFCRNDLRAALRDADATASLLLLPLIERASFLERDIAALRAAHDSDREATS